MSLIYWSQLRVFLTFKIDSGVGGGLFFVLLGLFMLLFGVDGAGRDWTGLDGTGLDCTV